MPDMCRAYDAYEAYEVWKGLFLTPSTAGNSFHRLRAVPLPRRGRSLGRGDGGRLHSLRAMRGTRSARPRGLGGNFDFSPLNPLGTP